MLLARSHAVIGDLRTVGIRRYLFLSSFGDDATGIARSSRSLQRPPSSSARRPALFLIIIYYKIAVASSHTWRPTIFAGAVGAAMRGVYDATNRAF